MSLASRPRDRGSSPAGYLDGAKVATLFPTLRPGVDPFLTYPTDCRAAARAPDAPGADHERSAPRLVALVLLADPDDAGDRPREGLLAVDLRQLVNGKSPGAIGLPRHFHHPAQ